VRQSAPRAVKSQIVCAAFVTRCIEATVAGLRLVEVGKTKHGRGEVICGRGDDVVIRATAAPAKIISAPGGELDLPMTA
jgi:hypothetical protein